MPSSSHLRDAAIAVGAAVALAASFPKFGAAWLVPIAMATLFWVWQGSSIKFVAFLGWLSGIVFFAMGYSLIGHAVGAYGSGAFSPVLVEATFSC